MQKENQKIKYLEKENNFGKNSRILSRK